ncbi:Uncharacterised protein [Chlamydia trachomatis]|nr:Uncharacterised protein [Chlamydia trachomatis]
MGYAVDGFCDDVIPSNEVGYKEKRELGIQIVGLSEKCVQRQQLNNNKEEECNAYAQECLFLFCSHMCPLQRS